MSRIGNQPITIPEGIQVQVNGSIVNVTGSRGTLSVTLPSGISAALEGNILTVKANKGRDGVGALHGTLRTLIQNAITGVQTGWQKKLELVGVGYRANVVGADLVLTIGYSHPVTIAAPKGITFSVAENTITVSGADKQMVGELAAIIRRQRPPEPYKGKGIRIQGEKIRRKAGKAAKAVGGAPGAK